VSEAELPTLNTYLPTSAVQDTELGDIETINMFRSSWTPLPDNYTAIEIQRMDRPYSLSNLEYGNAYGALIAVVLV